LNTPYPKQSLDRFGIANRIGEEFSPGVYFLKLDGKEQTPARVVKLR
jgi:hypothetical protein